MTPQLLTVIDKETLQTWDHAEWSKWIVEMKWDGARLIYHKGKFLSRTGKPLNNLGHIGAELSKIPGVTWDGEIAGEDWASTMSTARSTQGKKDGRALKFHVFDCMWDEHWAAQSCKSTLLSRRASVMSYCEDFSFEHVTAVSYDVVSYYAAFERLHEVHLRAGCDGTVLKKIGSTYEFKRTKTWLKVKPVETFDGKVIGMIEGKGKYGGMLGALIVNFNGVTTKVSGMDDQQRKDWWYMTQQHAWSEHPNYIIGKTIEVAARGTHKSGCLIEPRFIRIREDK